MLTRKTIGLLASLAVLIVQAPLAKANDYPQVQLYFTGQTSGGDLDPYNIIISQVGSSPTSGYSIWMNCDDYNDTIAAGSFWTANVIQGWDGAGLVTTRMSTVNKWNQQQAMRAYDAKAWLELHYDKSSNPAYSNALWAIFDPAISVTGNTLYTQAMAAADADAGNNYASYRGVLTIYSPLEGTLQGSYQSPTHTGQEFNRIVPDGGTTLALLGGALFGIEVLRRKYRI